MTIEWLIYNISIFKGWVSKEIIRVSKNFKFTIELNVGDKIDLGRFKNVRSEIKDIKLDDHGQPVIITSKGEKKALSFRLVKLDEGKS